MNDLKTDLSENVQYDFSDYSAYIRKGILSHYPDFSALSHWHDDVEFITIISGTMDYNINGSVITLNEGEGLFVNSRHLHFGFSKNKNDCEFICVLLHPLMLCLTPQFEETYISPVLTNLAFSYWILHDTVSWENTIINAVNKMYYELDEKAPQLQIQSLFHQIWLELYLHLPEKTTKTQTTSYQLSCTKDMIRYIQTNYKKKISLDDISLVGNVCKSKCCALFRQYLNQTPVNYLIKYRLQKSIELLSNSNLNITEISFEVGFSGTSYFIETFQKHFKCSPLEYRKKLKN